MTSLLKKIADIKIEGGSGVEAFGDHPAMIDETLPREVVPPVPLPRILNAFIRRHPVTHSGKSLSARPRKKYADTMCDLDCTAPKVIVRQSETLGQENELEDWVPVVLGTLPPLDLEVTVREFGRLSQVASTFAFGILIWTARVACREAQRYQRRHLPLWLKSCHLATRAIGFAGCPLRFGEVVDVGSHASRSCPPSRHLEYEVDGSLERCRGSGLLIFDNEYGDAFLRNEKIAIGLI
ncbi:hypothetical protein N431DRAFT_523339 [Stipitochalara longipes BDJ]|nr:hypothetical protein N431DRAFT_523339 [Stipitochalara longipes BDJ]